MITHKFLDGGHIQNEDDSVHRTIESAAKNITVYTLEQWYSTVRMARCTLPYYLKEMQGRLPGFQRTQQMPDRF